MTQSFALNNRNDLFIGADGRLAIATGLEAVLFACQNAVQALLGEMPFDVDRGMPNFETIWNGSPNLAQFEAAARAMILSVDGVVAVQSFTVGIVGDVVQYAAVIETRFGTDTING